MKIHRPLVQAVVHTLLDIFLHGKFADKVIEQALKSNPKWGSRDRAFIAETTYDVVRNWRLLRSIEGSADLHLTETLLVRLAGIQLLLKNIPLPDWEEFAGWEVAAVLSKKQSLEGQRSVIESVPDWMDEMGVAELGEHWGEELHALNQVAPIVLRVNSLKTNKAALQKLLSEQGWNATETPLSPDALVLERRGNIYATELFQSGLFEVQDAGSQCIAPFLQAGPGMRVVDACAGAGGKTLHLACQMENRGSIIALDTEGWKLQELRKRATRNGVAIVQTRTIESSKTIKRLYGSADRLLLDVPCSGTGVLRRNPDAKWRLSPEFLEKVRLTQADILEKYSRILRPGGRMVYATCSIFPSENERQVEAFLQKNSAFQLMEERNISPAREGFDGFYMALLEATNVGRV